MFELSAQWDGSYQHQLQIAPQNIPHNATEFIDHSKTCSNCSLWLEINSSTSNSALISLVMYRLLPSLYNTQSCSHKQTRASNQASADLA